VPKTPDRKAGDRSETAIVFDDTNPTVTTQEGEQRYSGEVFRLRDAAGEFLPLGVNRHKAVRQLIHFIEGGPAEGFASGAFHETLPAANPFPTSFIWWTNSGKTEKIVELTVTYTGILPTTEEWKMYDTDGTTVLVTVTDTIVYSGVFETSRTRAIT
jgi:hypothetical protein